MTEKRLTWIHSDKKTDCGVQLDVFSKEDKHLLLISDGILNTLHLHRYDGENFHRDSVELIKAAPGT